MSQTLEQFTNDVVARLMAEHGGGEERFKHLVEKIHVAFETEHGITTEQLDQMFHGSDVAASDELERLFPLLNAIALEPYSRVEDEEDEENDDDDDDGEEDEEEEED